MIARTKPYDLTTFGSTLDTLAAQTAAPVPAPAAQLAAALDARRLFESIAANPLDAAWSETDAWGGQFDGTRLMVAGPRAMIAAAYQGNSVTSVRIDTPAGSRELDFGPAATRVRITDTTGVASDCTFPAIEAPDLRDWETTITSVVAGWKEMAQAEAAAAAASAAQAAAAEPASQPQEPEKQWYYVQDGQGVGPVPESELRRALTALPPDTLVWNPDLPEWKPASEAVPARAPAFELVDRSGVRYALAVETRIGRGAACEAMLPDDMASRVHAIVSTQPDGYWIADNQSLNGTIVNGVRLSQPVRLSPGDVLQIGATELIFQSASGAPPEPSAPLPVFYEEPTPERPMEATMMIAPTCPHCGGMNPLHVNFCQNCGVRLR